MVEPTDTLEICTCKLLQCTITGELFGICPWTPRSTFSFRGQAVHGTRTSHELTKGSFTLQESLPFKKYQYPFTYSGCWVERLFQPMIKGSLMNTYSRTTPAIPSSLYLQVYPTNISTRFASPREPCFGAAAVDNPLCELQIRMSLFNSLAIHNN